MTLTVSEASMAVKSRLVTIATGKAAASRKGFRLPNLVRAVSDLNPTTGAHIASQIDPMAEMVPATAGFTPATVVKNKSRYVPASIYMALSHTAPTP